MNRRILITIGIVLIASLMMIIIWLTFFRAKSTVELPATNLNINQGTMLAVDNLPPPAPTRIQQEEDYPLGVKQLAFSFAERYGSYSNQAPNDHINDLMPLMTLRMQREITEDYEQDNLNLTTYDGYEARALGGELQNFSTNQAKVLVNIQRVHYREGLTEPDVFYQDILVELLKFGDEWKVDRVQWYPKK